MKKHAFNPDGVSKKKVKKEFINMQHKDKMPPNIQQGWQCPVCRRVNSPTSTSCPCWWPSPSAPLYPTYPGYLPYDWSFTCGAMPWSGRAL